MKKAWQSWKKIMERVGNFQASVIFSILYFLLIVPIGIVTKGSDFLKRNSFPHWLEFSDNCSTLKKMRSQG